MNWALEHILDAAAVGVLAWMVSLTLRRAPASARYGVWLVALAKFTLPSGLLVLAAGWIESLLPGKAVMPAGPVAPILLRIRSGADFPPIHAASHLGILLFVIWLAGVVWVAAATIIGHRGMQRRLEKGGQPAPEWLRARIPEHVRLLITREPIEPVQWGIRRPRIALPEEMLARLTPEELDSVLSHELAHVTRRDNAAQLFEAILAALFWFHPALWWIERRVQEERERACDEAVIGAGGNPRAYASAILKICGFSLGRPVAGFAGVTGGHLKRRMEGILSGRIDPERRCHRACIASLAAVIIGVPLAIGLVTSVPASAQNGARSNVRVRVLGPDQKTAASPSPRMRAIVEALKKQPVSGVVGGVPGGVVGGVPGGVAGGVIGGVVGSTSELGSATQKEHERRIELADRKFAEGDTPGSETDRGRVYVMLGPPDEIDSHPADKFEEWRYRSIDGGQGLEITFTLHR